MSATKPGARSKLDRVRFCMQKMVDGEWTRNKMLRAEWAAELGITEDVLRMDSQEASRALALSRDELDALRAENVAQFERIAQLALSIPSSVTGIPDFRSAIEALKLRSEYAGLKMDTAPEDVPREPTVIKILLTEDDEEKRPDG